MVLMSTVGFGMSATACCSAANAALVSMHAFNTDLVSSSTAGGSSGKSLKGSSELNAMNLLNLLRGLGSICRRNRHVANNMSIFRHSIDILARLPVRCSHHAWREGTRGRVPSHQRGPHSQPWRHSQRTQRLGHSLRQPDTGCNRLNLKGIFAIKLEAAPRYQLSNFYNKDLRVVNLATLILRLTSDAQSQPRNVRRCYSGSRSSPASLRGWNLPASFC
jgi:hypothetical protein